MGFYYVLGNNIYLFRNSNDIDLNAIIALQNFLSCTLRSTLIQRTKLGCGTFVFISTCEQLPCSIIAFQIRNFLLHATNCVEYQISDRSAKNPSLHYRCYYIFIDGMPCYVQNIAQWTQVQIKTTVGRGFFPESQVFSISWQTMIKI